MITTLWSGLSTGSIYGIVAMVMMILYTRCGLFNFAQGFILILGNYLTYELVLHGWGILAVFAVLLTIGAVLGAAQELLTVRPTKGAHQTALVTTVGVGIAIQGFILAAWGTDPRTVPFFAGNQPFNLLGGSLYPDDLWLIGLLVVVAVSLQVAVKYTRWGIDGRAAADDMHASMLRGINIPRLRTAAFVLASAVSCGIAPFVAPKVGASTDSSLQILTFGFAAMSAGGFGASFVGTAAGGLAVGLVEALAGRYLSAPWIPVLVFAVLVAGLTIRPAGRGRLV